jgi:hypothetical protein
MLVATVLTTALITGAARGAAAPASKHPATESVARRLVAKLTSSFRQTLPGARLAPLRVSLISAKPVAVVPSSIALLMEPFETSPLQYPTPPPVL